MGTISKSVRRRRLDAGRPLRLPRSFTGQPTRASPKRAPRPLGIVTKSDSPYLFIGQRGNGLTPKGVADIVRKYTYQAGLQDVSPHTLRHSFGKHSLDAGVDLVTVATLLG